MGKLKFGMMASLDGYISDVNGRFEWGQISEEVHRFAEREQAGEAIAIYGRRMFETMAVWDTLWEDASLSQAERDFSLVWRGTDKIVVSRSLRQVGTSRTRLVHALSAEDIAALKGAPGDIGVAGPTLAASLLRQGLIDEISIYFIPVLVGGGTPMFPEMSALARLERLEVRPFENGVTFMRFAVRSRAAQ
ncbi:deaminase [Youhaiella tibetensis]|uniref:Riboflavin biosynthesis protein RibD n=1 Tax=Paradevosia tibetensis TaxID=1447062 RepID=A0A5B9DSN9_9HYPH|nr:dihydrofolate reductase family protein [Youhaiella tibetensis]QEE22176.1 riboflavin biosynthesis protein RibD [Youhaiella tibetensis]GGF44632.1 deaminase [Youhaiella tibetensis]